MNTKNNIATKTLRRKDSPRCFTSANPICENLRAFSAKICVKFFHHRGTKTIENRRGFYFWPLRENLLMAVAGVAFFSSCSQPGSDSNAEYQNVDSLYLIPEPVSLEKREGSFKISNDTYLTYSADLQNEGLYVNNLIDSASDFSLKQNLEAKVKSSEIELKIVNDFPPELQHGEAYRLIISPEKLQITALTSTGIMRGIQTIRQLFIPAFHSGENRSVWYIPCLKIEDKPKFEHRGLMLDVCRHFFEKEVIFKYIDALAFYKMNILHLHLTEDQGWRIQIDKYPRLNEISSYRKEKDGTVYGGYYTKEDLKEIVAYAKERHIIVIPEIELPGHSQAALAAYPQFSCNGGPIEVVNEWGVFKEIYCAGNDSTFTFLEDILTEVMEIFPAEYIHIGGDEAPKFRWENCAKCQKRMKDEGLHNEHELQSYFIQRIEKFLNSKGRKLIGWDEILEGGLSENATVQSWRGMEGGLTAAQQKHYVIMSPTSHCYLDYGLDAIDLKKVYEFNPIPPQLEPALHKYILGAEVNMWTERVPDEENLDSKVFPRMIALAEMLWSGPDTSRYASFYERLQRHYPILEFFGLKFGSETVALKIATYTNEQIEFFARIHPNVRHLDIKYKFHCDQCDTSFKDYDYIAWERLHMWPGQLAELEVRAYKNDKQYGEPFFQKLACHEALFATVVYENKYDAWYTGGGDSALVDGKLGSINFRDGNWQGFWGTDLSVILRLRSKWKASRITMNFLEYPNAWIMSPNKFLIYHSQDGENWQKIVPTKTIPVNTSVIDGISINPFIIEFDEISPRYLKIEVKNYGKLPSSHEAAGQNAWLFIDEIVVE